MELSLIYIFFGRAIPAVVAGFVVSYFMGELYEKKYTTKWYVLLYTAFTIITFLVQRRKNFPINYIYILLCLLLISRYFYTEQRNRGIVNSICFMIYISGIQVIDMPLYNLLRYQKELHSIERPEGTLITGIISALIWVCTYKLVVEILNRKKIDRTKWKQYIFMIFISMFEYAVIYRLVSYTKETTEGSVLLWIGSGFLVIDVYLISLFSSIEKKDELEKSVALLNQQAVFNHKYYENIEMTFLQMRRNLHDVRNHIQVLEETYGKKNPYGKEILESLRGISGEFYCTNRILNIIINVKKKECERELILLQLDIANIEELSLTDMEITTIFANLFDNAISALKLVKPIERRLQMNMLKIQNSVLIYMENPYNGVVNKVPQKGHWGLGLVNIQSVVERHAGNVVIDSKSNIFKVSIMIPIEKRL